MAVDYNGKICNDYPHAKNSRAAGTILHAVKMAIFTNNLSTKSVTAGLE